MGRVAFYSHDTFGLGHLRRCLKLIAGLQSSIDGLEGLLITGSPWTHLFACPQGFEFARLPPIVKCGSRYRPLGCQASLAEVLAHRQRSLQAILAEFAPELLIVDNVPCGLRGEMLEALRFLRATGGTRCVLALRDVLDRIGSVAREWSEVGAGAALEDLYHEVWVFGDEEDLAEMMGLPGMSSVPSLACGRIGPEAGSLKRSVIDGGNPGAVRSTDSAKVLVTGGGGGDAEPLITAYLEMLRRHRPPIRSHLVLGPDFPSDAVTKVSGNNGFAARVDRFVPNLPQVIERSDVVVAMAGYNTTCEIEAVGRPAVLVPRIWPREEQLLRARRQERAGRALVLHPHELTPKNLWKSIRACLDRPRPEPVHHRGAETAARHAARLLDQDPVANKERLAS